MGISVDNISVGRRWCGSTIVGAGSEHWRPHCPDKLFILFTSERHCASTDGGAAGVLRAISTQLNKYRFMFRKSSRLRQSELFRITQRRWTVDVLLNRAITLNSWRLRYWLLIGCELSTQEICRWDIRRSETSKDYFTNGVFGYAEQSGRTSKNH